MLDSEEAGLGLQVKEAGVRESLSSAWFSSSQKGLWKIISPNILSNHEIDDKQLLPFNPLAAKQK